MDKINIWTFSFSKALFCESHNRYPHIWWFCYKDSQDLNEVRLTSVSYLLHNQEGEKDTTEVDQAIGSGVFSHDIAQDVLILTALQHVQSISTLKRTWILESRDFIGGWWIGTFHLCDQLWLSKLQTPKMKADVYHKSHHLHKLT